MARGRAQTLLVAALVVLAGALSPRDAQAFTKAVWGPVTRNGVDQFPLYRRLGAGLYEADLLWSEVATRRPAHPGDPGDPAYAWPPEIDAAIADARRHHMRVMLDLFGSPAWENGSRGFGWIPAHPRDFAAFAGAAARRYPHVHLWMVWKEPTKAANFQPLTQQPPGVALGSAALRFPHVYAEMLDGAYGQIKSANRADLVIGGCTYSTGAIDTLHWIVNLRLPGGRRPRMDMYAHNPFSYRDPWFRRTFSPFDEVQFSDLPRLATWLDRYLRPGLPLFLSEWEIPTARDNEFDFWVDPGVAARWIAHALSEARAWRRVYALGWVRIRDDPPTSAGGLLTATGQPKATFAAFQHG